MTHFITLLLCAVVLAALLVSPASAGQYKNFTVAIYIRCSEVEKMKDPEYLAQTWQIISSQLKVDKVYIETYRDRTIVDDDTIEKVKAFFAARGIETAGGLALVSSERNRFETFCYTDPADRAYVKNLVEHTAKHFNEIILDDFFFTDTKNASDIKAKGKRSWSQFRMDLMKESAEDLIIKPAKAVNPGIKMVIKFPNWYEHFPGCGYDLADEPRLFDGIYTGTETRDPNTNGQHLQQYESYGIIRYFDNIKPGGNGGGWVDTFGTQYLDRYAEQIWLTLFAKAREITLFSYGELLQALTNQGRGAWQGTGTSFDMDRVLPPGPQQTAVPVTYARAAGYSLEQINSILGALGQPIGVAAYRPPVTGGEDYLHNYFGNVGIPLEMTPNFPDTASVAFLTEGSKADPNVVTKIESRLQAGGTVVITSGLLKALDDRGIQDIAEVQCTDQKAIISQVLSARGAVTDMSSNVLIPQIHYLTNDTWSEVSGLASGSGFPLLLSASYGGGKMYVITVPDNPADLYALPPQALDPIRRVLTSGLFVHIEGPAEVALFAYDNNTFVVESFCADPQIVHVALDPSFTAISDLSSGEKLPAVSNGLRSTVDIIVKPHSYRAFTADK